MNVNFLFSIVCLFAVMFDGLQLGHHARAHTQQGGVCRTKTSYSARADRYEEACQPVWLIDLVLIVCGQQWCSVAQRNKIYRLWLHKQWGCQFISGSGVFMEFVDDKNKYGISPALFFDLDVFC